MLIPDNFGGLNLSATHTPFMNGKQCASVIASSLKLVAIPSATSIAESMSPPTDPDMTINRSDFMATNPQDEIQKIVTLLKSGKPDLAFKKAIAGAKKHPANPIFPQMAGAALVAKEKHGAAAPHFHKSYKIKPDHAEFQDNLARSLISSGQIDSAEALLSKHADARQGSATYHHLWALLYMSGKRFQQAADAATGTLQLQAGHLDALIIRGKALAGLLQSDRALQDFDAALAAVPNHREAIEGRASALASLGRVDEAKQQYLELLALDPTHIQSQQVLAGLPGLSDQDLIELDSHLDHTEAELTKTKDARLFTLGFARHEVAMRRGQAAEAMQHLSRAKAQAARSHPFDDAAAERQCKAVLALEELPVAFDPDVSMPRPIFVVGLPRSGTTLMEMTISAHAAVKGCGELPSVGQWVKRNTQITSADGLAKAYRARLPHMQSSFVAFVDKMPENYRYLGYIAAAFPDSVIINVDRDPRDVALSMWRKNFSSDGMAYTNDQRHMAAEANRYRRYLNHWTAKFGEERIYSVCYEDLVADFTTQVPQIASACGLEWDPAMLMPEANTAAVKTASRFQVRQAVHTGSIKAWERFADELEVFCAHLDTELWAHYL